MTRNALKSFVFACALLLAWPLASLAQVATGAPPFGSFSGGPDVVNNANLNVHLSVPVLNKAGRGMPFYYNLAYDSSVWYPVTAGSTTTWTEVPNAGWHAETEVVTGYVYYYTSQYKCFDSGSWYFVTRYYFRQYHDMFGAVHPFLLPAVSECPRDPDSASALNLDGSGYSISVSPGSATVYAPSGEIIHPPLQSGPGSGTVIDANGNQISASSTSFTDTLGKTALSISGAPPGEVDLQYTSASGAATVKLIYSSLPVRTHFNCSGISEYGPTTQSLLTEIDLPDDNPNGVRDRYLIAYESTPGYAGDYTGRIASITLPTGGIISYQYSGGGSGVNGITCGDGGGAILTRTTPDGAWTYTRTQGSGAAWTTTLQDPALNNTTMNFQGIYETSRTFPGSLGSSTTCYNGATAPCDSTAITLPITRRTVLTTLGSKTSEVDTTYDTAGRALPTDVKEYDFGTSPNPGGLVRETSTAYNTTLNGIGIYDHPSTITITGYNGQGQWGQVSQTSFQYDSKGNTTQVSSGGLAQNYTYNPNGTVHTSADPSGTTTYGYGGNSCSAFPDSITPPISSLASTAIWNCDAAVPTSTTDANLRTTTFSYDTMNRVTQVSSSPDGAQTGYAYNPYGGGSNWADTVTTVLLKSGSPAVNRVTTVEVDGLGRTIHTLLTSDPGGTTIVDTTYDILGRAAATTNPYRGSPCSPITQCETQYAYDALNRVTAVTNADGTSSSVVYADNCSTATDESGKARKVCLDALGRATNVYEDPGGLNYATSYSYDGLDDLLTVSQGSQTRTYQYDSLGRLTSAATPEATNCAITYSYDTHGDLATRVAPAPNQTSCATTVTTTYGYDSMHRLTGKSYSNGNPSAITYYYDQTSYNGLTITDGKGQRTGMSDGSGQTAWSYDAAGRPVTERRTIGTVSETMNYGYNQDGSLASVAYPSTRVVNYDITGAGLPTYAKDTGNGINYAQSATYAPQGALSSMVEGYSGTFNGITLNAGYNNRLFLNTLTATSQNGTAANFAFGYFANGSVQTVTNNRNTNRTETLTYDSLNRLSTAQSAATSGADCWGQSIPSDGTGYDRYGNLLIINSTKCSSLSLNVGVNGYNHITNSGFSYDAAGNLTGDGFTSYAWDDEGRLTSAGSTSYTYDGDGRRVKKGSSVLYWYGLSATPMAETDSAGNNPVEYIFFGGARIARRDASGNVNYYFADQIGSTRTLTDATGHLCYDADFYPFGGERTPYLNTCGQTYKFADMERDSETQNDHTMFRYYASNTGRWLSPDPLGGDVTNPQSLNRYAYAMNNPANFIDPQGLRNCPLGPGGACGPSHGASIGGGWLGGGGDTPVYQIAGMQISASEAAELMHMGAATLCPNNNCMGVEAHQGSGGSVIVKKWVPGHYAAPTYGTNPDTGALTIEVHWVPGQWVTVATIDGVTFDPDLYRIQFISKATAGFAGTPVKVLAGLTALGMAPPVIIEGGGTAIAATAAHPGVVAAFLQLLQGYASNGPITSVPMAIGRGIKITTKLFGL
jgi:RHS repeat-associated protein